MKRLKVGDLVQVMTGGENLRGKQGRITKILADHDKVVVEGLNMVTRHMRPNARNQKGGKVTKEAPIAASNVMPVDPTTGKPTRIMRVTKEVEGKTTNVRLTKSGAEI